MTPPESEKTFSEQVPQLNPEAKDYIHHGKIDSARAQDRRDTLRHIMWLYATDLAKECKSQCPMVRKGKCKCQSNGDKVLSGLEILSSDAPLEVKFWDRFLKNTTAMLEIFWIEHGDTCPPSKFDLGFYGFKLLQAFKKDEFWAEKDLFRPILEVQFRALLEEILPEESIPYFTQMEEIVADEIGNACFFKDDS